MLKPEMENALNKHMNAELYSSYLYLSMSAYCQTVGLVGFANWMRVQAQEELVHGMKFFNYIKDRGRAQLQPIEGPPVEWKNMLEIFDETCKHEALVTSLINKLVDLSIEHSDHATNNFLQWFVAEQVEEEAAADEIRQQIKLVGSDGAGLFMLDKDLGTRTFVMPAGVTI